MTIAKHLSLTAAISLLSISAAAAGNIMSIQCKGMSKPLSSDTTYQDIKQSCMDEKDRDWHIKKSKRYNSIRYKNRATREEIELDFDRDNRLYKVEIETYFNEKPSRHYDD